MAILLSTNSPQSSRRKSALLPKRRRGRGSPFCNRNPDFEATAYYVKSIASNDRNQTLGPHPEEAALFARPSRRMAAGTVSRVAVLRDARILRQAQERAPQDEADG